MTHADKNALNDEQLKERLNFSKMFDRQKGQIKQTAHIKNLLTPSTKEDSLSQGVQSLENDYQLEKIEAKLQDRLGIIENNLIQKIENIKTPNPGIKPGIYFDLSNKNLVYKLIAGALVCSLLVAIGLSPKETIVTKEKIVYKATPAKQLPTPKKYVLTKFVNIRSSASSKGAKITTLAPNSIVKFIETKHGWTKIEYRDHLKEKTITGWAYGENLKEI